MNKHSVNDDNKYTSTSRGGGSKQSKVVVKSELNGIRRYMVVKTKGKEKLRGESVGTAIDVDALGEGKEPVTVKAESVRPKSKGKEEKGDTVNMPIDVDALGEGASEVVETAELKSESVRPKSKGKEEENEVDALGDDRGRDEENKRQAAEVKSESVRPKSEGKDRRKSTAADVGDDEDAWYPGKEIVKAKSERPKSKGKKKCKSTATDDGEDGEKKVRAVMARSDSIRPTSKAKGKGKTASMKNMGGSGPGVDESAVKEVLEGAGRLMECLWPKCDVWLGSWELLRKHVEKRHCQPLSEEELKTASSSRPYECRYATCRNQTFASPAALLNHMVPTHLDEELLTCPLGCRRAPTTLQGITQHLATVHSKAPHELFKAQIQPCNPPHIPISLQENSNLPLMLNCGILVAPNPCPNFDPARLPDDYEEYNNMSEWDKVFEDINIEDDVDGQRGTRWRDYRQIGLMR
ncbi:hypothetical protein M422DRAFT_68694 [Sphaerobolus stellatus SS14]|uniref:C2H2-type domain-containing protein n=1 Tax=Sphaerobolus stellatus (strain SS14) TaxID=990650 RepID=A0A0C9VP56_SPHS4|nr:hypothetical protein M422DRAFT_68694 [Sphaerobolus stellatus SS14]